jgi:hypothetical protein
MVSILENLTLNDIEEAFGKELLKQGEALYENSAVIDLGFEKKDNTLWGIVEDRHNDYRAQVNFEPERILMQCECGRVKTDLPCSHVVTLLVLLVRNRDILLGDGSETEDIAGGFSSGASERTHALQPMIDLTQQDVEADYRERLSALTVGEMREMAARRGIKVSGQRREGIMNALAAGLAQPQNLVDNITTLSREAHLVLDLLLILGEKLEKVHIASILHWFESALAGQDPAINIQDRVNTLAGAGFIFTTDVHLHLPKALRSYREQNPALVKRFSGIVGKPEKAMVGDFVRHALWLILLNQTGSLECNPTNKIKDYGGWPSSQALEKPERNTVVPPFGSYLKPEILKRLSPIIGQPPEKIDYIARLLAQTGVWKPDSFKELIPVFSRWLKEGLAQQCRELWATAKTLEVPVELDMAREAGSFKVIRNAFLHFPYQFYIKNLIGVRQLFFRLLEFLPGGDWIDFQSVLQLVYGLAPDFIPENYNNRQLWLELKDGQVNTSNFDAWRKSYGLYYQAIVEGILHWLGMCELWHQDGQLLAFRLTPFAEFILGYRDAFDFLSLASDLASVSFTGDELIEINPAVSTPEIINLVMLLGEIEPVRGAGTSQNSAQMGSRLAYRILNEGLGRVFEAGWTGERLQAELQEAARMPVPEKLAEKIKVSWERYGRLRIYADIALVQFGDDYCLPELLAGTHLGQHLLYRFSPRLIAVRPEKVEGILAELRSKGYTPRLREQERG